ncbi:hypothetical protein E2C01_072792 [Portunus trituberculatus]|uniref:Uncharacterized protein n=1 Tax=Portunus trituberculatus TaxID=210409 RepID=A0A5B7IBM7_PORTR|nr:hypothetical protein [Portunus trituberculatus]
MNNILLLLWAERIYTDFIEPVETSVGNPEYCLNAAIALMEDTASVLYLQAVAPDVKARDAQVITLCFVACVITMLSKGLQKVQGIDQECHSGAGDRTRVPHWCRG